MDLFWTVLLIAPLILWLPLGFLGSGIGMNLVLWFCDWYEGAPINWPAEVAFTLAVPFVWFFAIIEIIILFKT